MFLAKKIGIDGVEKMETYKDQFTESYKKRNFVMTEILWRLMSFSSLAEKAGDREITALREEVLKNLDEEGILAYEKRKVNHDCYYWLALLQHVTDLDHLLAVFSDSETTDISLEEQVLKSEFVGEDRERAILELKKCREADAWLLVYLAAEQETDILPHEVYFLSDEEQKLWRRLTAKQKAVYRAELPQDMPLVSIMIPTYNRPDIFLRTIRSAAIQEYPNLEIIVSDNSTNEDTAQIMNYYQYDKRITYVRNKEAKNKAENFEIFKNLSKGEYLQWLMDDDILAPHKITEMARVLYLNNHISLVASRRGFIDEYGDEIPYDDKRLVEIKDKAAVFSGNTIGYYILRQSHNVIGEPPTVLFRRAQLKHHYWRAESNGYFTISDVVMWLELLKKGDFYCFRESLSFYRRHSGQEGQQLEVCLLSRIEWGNLIDYYYKKRRYITKKEDYLAALRRIVREYELKILPYDKSVDEMWHRYDEKMKQLQKIVAVG